MDSITKKARGKVLDLETGRLHAEADLQVVSLPNPGPKSHRSYLARLTVEGSHPDMDSKIHMLELENGTSGHVYLTMAENHDEAHTEFVVVFRGQTWEGHDWFNDL